MPLQKLKEFLDGQNIKYLAISHSTAYTAQEIAALAHVRGKDLAKTVVVKSMMGSLWRFFPPRTRSIFPC